METAGAGAVAVRTTSSGKAEDRAKAARAGVRTRVDVNALALEMGRRGETFAIATVVRVVPPTSGKPSDKAVIRPSGEVIGWVGGSCTSSAVTAEGLAAIREGRPRLLRLTPAAGLEPVPEGMVEYTMECLSGGIMEIFIEPRIPAPRLLVVGPSPIAEALSALGRTMEYDVVVVAPRADPEAYPDASQVVRDLDTLGGLITPDTYAVVATMGKYDETALRALASSPAPYVGLVASRKRAAGVLAALRKAKIPDSALGRIRNPAGLDVSAKTAPEIALSILAEIVQVRRTSAPREIPVVEAAVTSRHKAVDVVCGMEVDPDTPLTTVHEGTTYYFCSEMCRTRFLESPASFLT